MPAPSVLLLRTAGTNCDVETTFAFELAGAIVHPIHIRALCQSPQLLQEHAIVVLPGGFSYGDDLGSGTVLANEIVQRLIEPFRRFVERGGLMVGICNGFQVLVKTGLLPGLSYAPKTPAELPGATLTFNESQKFEDRWVTLRIERSQSPFLEGDNGRLIEIPVAHGEGRFVTRDEATLQRMETGNQVAFRYVKPDGSVPTYPQNPNGAQNDIAGVTDETGRVLGLMPHPERHVLGWQHPRWTREGIKREGDGIFLFRNAIRHASKS